MNLAKKIVPIAAVAFAVALFAAQPALADGSVYSTDANLGAHTIYTTANHHLTTYDRAYDGWGTGAYVTYSAGGGGACQNEQGYNTSTTCLLTPGYSITYNACLEHNQGATIAYCSARIGDNS